MEHFTNCTSLSQIFLISHSGQQKLIPVVIFPFINILVLFAFWEENYLK